MRERKKETLCQGELKKETFRLREREREKERQKMTKKKRDIN